MNQPKRDLKFLLKVQFAVFILSCFSLWLLLHRHWNGDRWNDAGVAVGCLAAILSLSLIAKRIRG